MEFVEGHILRSAPEAEQAFDETTRRAVGDHMADTLAALHAVDPDAVGLGDLARHDGYIERQLKRWRSQYDQMQVEGVDHGGVVERVSDELARRIPVQQRTSVVHGDYRMDNVVLADDGTVKAILDWEICTLGDPLADLGRAHGLLGRPDRLHGRAGAVADHGAGLQHPGRRSWSATTRCPISTRRASATTWPSATGSSPASSRASTPATWPGRARATRDRSTGFPVQIGRLFQMAADALEAAP